MTSPAAKLSNGMPPTPGEAWRFGIRVPVHGGTARTLYHTMGFRWKKNGAIPGRFGFGTGDYWKFEKNSRSCKPVYTIRSITGIQKYLPGAGGTHDSPLILLSIFPISRNRRRSKQSG